MNLGKGNKKISVSSFIQQGYSFLEQKPFTEKQLHEFNNENKLLKEIAKQSAAPDGMKLREKQELLLKEIQKKYKLEISY